MAALLLLLLLLLLPPVRCRGGFGTDKLGGEGADRAGGGCFSFRFVSFRFVSRSKGYGFGIWVRKGGKGLRRRRAGPGLLRTALGRR